MPEKNQGVKKFFLKLLLLAVILFTVDRTGGYLLRKLYFTQVAGDYCRANYAIDSTKSETLVLGSSRASHHYVPSIFNDVLGKNFYNTGRDGSEILNNYAIFKAIVKRYIPELIVLEISPKELYYAEENYDKLSTLLPYYATHPEIRKVVDLKGKFEKYKMYSAIYPFNSQLVSLIMGKMHLTKDPGLATNGYLPLYPKMKEGEPDNLLKDPVTVIDSNKINALNELIATCKERNIQLFLIYSPIYNNAKYVQANIEIKKITEHNAVTFWDFSTDTTFDMHPEYFKDNSHMNDEGARLFSTIIADSISKMSKHY